MESKGKSVLIADDEPDILEIISYNLRNEGYETYTARDGDDALQMSAQHKPDLIILDVMMPKKMAWKFAASYGRNQLIKVP